MILTCPSCGSRFQIPDGALGTAGRKVKCSACKHVWFQAAEATESEVSAPSVVDDAPPAIPPRPESDAEPSVDAKTGPDVAPLPREDPPADEPALDEPSPEVPSLDERPSLVVATAATDVQTSTSDADAAVADRSEVDQPSVGTPVEETSDSAPVDHTPDFDVSRVVGPDDADSRSSGGRVRALVLIVLLLVAAGAALYQWRADVLQAFPQTLPAYAALDLVGPPSSHNLKLEDVVFEVIDENGDKVLIVSGRVVNAGPDLSLLPMLRAELLDQAGQVTTFWTFVATAEVLAPGGDTGFRDIYPDPPVTGDETDILVTFDDLR